MKHGARDYRLKPGKEMLLLLFPGFVRIREVTCIVIIQNHELMKRVYAL